MTKKKESAAEWVDIDQLKEWDKNPRLNDHSVDEVAESIKRFGFGAPIVARKSTSEVIAGHTRLRAARKLGLKTVPVRLLDLSEADAHALALADNKLGELAEWDYLELSDLAEDIDLESLGFDLSELETLIELTPKTTKPKVPPSVMVEMLIKVESVNVIETAIGLAMERGCEDRGAAMQLICESFTNG
jgi:ParB-like chromosome segregation protein Spo0J